MRLKSLQLIAILSLIITMLCGLSALAFEYDYTRSQTKYDFTYQAIFGSISDFEQWRIEPLAYIRKAVQELQFPEPQILGSDAEERRETYGLTITRLQFPPSKENASPFEYDVVIARPNIPNGLPPLIAINGHGEVGGEGHGQAPMKLFRPGYYGDALASHGYTLIALPNTMHKMFAESASNTDYSFIWAKLADRAITVMKPQLAATKFIAVGNAAGGLTALVTTLLRDDIIALATNGAFFSLEFTRREYRLSNHPFCHDFRAFYGYGPIYALVAPRPLQIQMGANDGLWLGGGPAPPSSWFSGLKRGALAEETLGSYLLLKNVFDKQNAPIELFQHNGGHEDLNVSALMAFVEKNVPLISDSK